MNNTHIRVCQKSVFTGYNYEGVMVNLVVLPGELKLSIIHFATYVAIRGLEPN